MKPIEKTDYCAVIGLDPYLSAYFKTPEQADYLLVLVKRLKSQNRIWGDIEKDRIRLHDKLMETERAKMDAIEQLLERGVIEENTYLIDGEFDVLLELEGKRTLRSYDKEIREKLKKELEDQEFTNIEKLIAAINTVLRDDNSNK